MISGCAAVGILMTLSPKRAIDAAGGSLPGRELSIGLRDGDGSTAGWPAAGSPTRSPAGASIPVPQTILDFPYHRQWEYILFII